MIWIRQVWGCRKDITPRGLDLEAGCGAERGTPGEAQVCGVQCPWCRGSRWGEPSWGRICYSPSSIARLNTWISFWYPLVFEMTFLILGHKSIDSCSAKLYQMEQCRRNLDLWADFGSERKIFMVDPWPNSGVNYVGPLSCGFFFSSKYTGSL